MTYNIADLAGISSYSRIFFYLLQDFDMILSLETHVTEQRAGEFGKYFPNFKLFLDFRGEISEQQHISLTRETGGVHIVRGGMRSDCNTNVSRRARA